MVNKKGVSQGIPPIAQLSAIYFDAIPHYYDNAIPDTIIQTQHDTYERNEYEEQND